jgi:hypothetical protein
VTQRPETTISVRATSKGDGGTFGVLLGRQLSMHILAVALVLLVAASAYIVGPKMDRDVTPLLKLGNVKTSKAMSINAQSPKVPTNTKY